MWLIVAISGYFLLAVVNTVDKFLLGRRIPSPAVYAFYAGSLGILAFLLAPFGFLKIPSPSILFLAIAGGIFHVLAFLALFQGIKNYEVSRIIPAVGGFLPLFTFIFSFFFVAGSNALTFSEIVAFALLVLGTVLITYQRKRLTFQSIKIALLTAIFFAGFFISMKFVYLSHPFISGIIWSRLGAFLAVLFLFLFLKDVKEDLLKGPKVLQKKTWLILLPNEGLAAFAILLQNWAIALAPFAYLGIINALEGTRYFFLLIFAVILSLKFPQILKEEISRDIIFQKIIAILLIGGGLALLTLK